MTPDPATQDPLVEVESTTIWYPAWKDNTGDPIADSAKQLPMKPYYRATAVPTYVATFYKTTLDDSFIRDMTDAINADTWRGWAAGEAWVGSLEANPVDTDYGNRWKYEVGVRCMLGGWVTAIPDAGYSYKSGTGLKHFETIDGELIWGKLDGSGGPLGVDDDMQIINFYCPHETDFTALGF